MPTIGERFVVIGLGIIGQIITQILRANGCQVFGVDIDKRRVDLALELGAHDAALSDAQLPARIDTFTSGMGADGVIIAAGSATDETIRLAAEIARDRARVVAVGAVGLDVPRKPFFEKELTLLISRSYGPGRYDPAYELQGHDYPIGYVRWTEQRNMEEFLRLISAGLVRVAPLTTHRFDIEAGERAFELLESGEPSLGVLLTYPEPAAPPTRVVRLNKTAAATDRIGIGVIGAGAFARGVLLPAFARQNNCRLVGVATSSGVSARVAADLFKCEYATSDVARVLEDPNVQAVIVATRHDSHAELAARALEAGKSVFVEKPLAISAPQLDRVLAAEENARGILAVGFNRRFSDYARRLKAALPAAPLAIQYRINAGPIPATSWIQDAGEGGGRIIGEVCHFVDLVQFLTGELPRRISAIRPQGALDSASILIEMERGSTASINYITTGDRAFSKERIEVFGGGLVGMIEDFRELTIMRGGQRQRKRLLKPDKGFDAEAAAFLAAVTSGEPPVSAESLRATTRATFAIEEALRTNTIVELA